MFRRRALRHRSPVEWGVRAVFAAAAGLLGYGAVTQSIAYSLRTSAPEQAHALAPWDGRITAALAREQAGAMADESRRTSSDRLARLALRQDATAVAAAAVLGMNTQIRGNTPSARRLLAYAETLSRRDLPTQLWAVEDAVARNDIEGALKHYDIALRTSRSAPDVLFPVLASAISDSTIRSALIRRLQDKPAWTESFVYYVSRSGPDPLAAANLFEGLSQAKVPISNEATALLIGALISRGFFEEAWTYYASIRPGAARNMSRDPRFAAMLDTPSPFDWAPANDVGISSSIQRNGRVGLFSFATPPGIGGTLLSQMQMLPPGNYVLEGRSAGVDQPEESRPYWALVCRNTGELGRIPLPNSTQANGVFRGRFSVPKGCPLQSLILVARPSDMVSGVTGDIKMARLQPVPD